MTLVNYRHFAVEIVRDAASLLIHAGSCRAFRIAQAWANGNADASISAHAARESAERDARRHLEEPRNGGFEAATAAWLLLAEDIGRHVEEIISWVAMAKAARYAFAKHGTQIGALVEAEFDYIRSIETELMRERLVKFEVEWNCFTGEELDCPFENIGQSLSVEQATEATGLLKFDAEIGDGIRISRSESALRA